MTIAERRHERLEEQVTKWLESEGLSLHRQGNLYQVEDADLQPMTDLLPLSGIIEAVKAW